MEAGVNVQWLGSVENAVDEFLLAFSRGFSFLPGLL
jgi:hypothetical protein